MSFHIKGKSIDKEKPPGAWPPPPEDKEEETNFSKIIQKIRGHEKPEGKEPEIPLGIPESKE